MKYIHRDKFNEIIKWLDRREIIAVKGPRQSGKTTLMEMLEKYLVQDKKVNENNIFYINFEDRDESEKFEKNPLEYIKNFKAGNNKKSYFLIDEFQYVRNGGQKLKLLYDAYKDVKFIITGSSSLELTQHTASYMVGRMFSFDLFPFSFGEYLQVHSTDILNNYKEKSFSIQELLRSEDLTFNFNEDIYLKDMKRYFEEYILFGGYPEVIKAADIETRIMILKNIYNTYITRDIIELLKKTDMDTFRNLVRHIAVNMGDLVNYTSLAADVNSYFQEIKNYISILNETYILKSIKPYHKNLTTELKKNPKIYFIDTGLRNYTINNFNELKLRADCGRLVESTVLTSLLREEEDVKYWRTKSGSEIDFIILKGDKIIPLEVKYSAAFPVKLSRGFKNFLSEYNPPKALVLTGGYGGIEKINNTRVVFIPVWYFK